jgi:hypothetical protein
MRWSVLLLLCAGCRTQMLEDAEARPVTGIYRYSSTVEADDCSPAQGSVAGEGAVFVADAGMSIPIPVDQAHLIRLDFLDGTAGFESDVCGVSRSWLLDVVRSRAGELEIERITRWTGSAQPGCQGAPAKSCTVVDRLQYQLKERCADGCTTIISDPDGSVRCGCR